MKLSCFPDPGTEIIVHLRNGKCFAGWIADGHVFATENEQETLCLMVAGRGDNYITVAENGGNALWKYIDCSEIVAWEWDCRD